MSNVVIIISAIVSSSVIAALISGLFARKKNAAETDNIYSAVSKRFGQQVHDLLGQLDELRDELDTERKERKAERIKYNDELEAERKERKEERLKYESNMQTLQEAFRLLQFRYDQDISARDKEIAELREQIKVLKARLDNGKEC